MFWQIFAYHSMPEDKMQCGFLLNVITGQCSTIFQLLSSKYQTLLIRWNTLFVLNFGIHIFNCIRNLYFQCDCLASQNFKKICIFPHSLRKRWSVDLGRNTKIVGTMARENTMLLLLGTPDHYEEFIFLQTTATELSTIMKCYITLLLTDLWISAY